MGKRLNFKGNQISILKQVAINNHAIKINDLIDQCCIDPMIFQALTAGLYQKKYVYNPRVGYIKATKEGVRYLYALRNTKGSKAQKLVEDLNFKTKDDPNYPYPELITGEDN
jgi:hypothetical protein